MAPRGPRILARQNYNEFFAEESPESVAERSSYAGVLSIWSSRHQDLQ